MATLLFFIALQFLMLTNKVIVPVLRQEVVLQIFSLKYLLFTVEVVSSGTKNKITGAFHNGMEWHLE